MGKSGWWKGKTAREIAEFQLMEPRLCLPTFDMFKAAMEEALGRPVFTTEYGGDGRKRLEQELFHGAAAPTLDEVLDQLPKGKPVIEVMVPEKGEKKE